MIDFSNTWDTLFAPTARDVYSYSSFASKVGKYSWIGSVQGAVATWSNHGVKIVRKYRMLITDQVATARCTDPLQVQFLLLGQSPLQQVKEHRATLSGRAKSKETQ